MSERLLTERERLETLLSEQRVLSLPSTYVSSMNRQEQYISYKLRIAKSLIKNYERTLKELKMDGE